MTEQTLPSEMGPRTETVLDLDPQIRALERVRMVNEMRLINAATVQGSEHTPLEFVGDKEHAIAFMDMVQATTPTDRLGVILTTQTPGLSTDLVLAGKLNRNDGLVPVRGDASRDTTVVSISRDPDGTFHCKFGYSAKGTSVDRAANNNVNVHINTDPNSIVDESLYRMYKLTGNPTFTEVLGIRAEMRGKGAVRSTSKGVDPESHYATLGLNAYALRFLKEDTFESLVKGMKKEILRKLHPDVAHPSPEELDYLKRMLTSCAILENKATRESYSRWLK